MNQDVSFTRTERLFLINQFRILELLDESDDEYYSKARGILEGGYTLLYGELFHSISDEMSPARCNYVYDILDLHRAMRNSFNELKNKEGLALEDVTFGGFDGNNESDEQLFAVFLKEHQLWTDVLTAPGTPGDLNSHHSTHARYSKMLDKWQQITRENRHSLSAAQIKDILPYWKNHDAKAK